jgi:hypothetical protein
MADPEGAGLGEETASPKSISEYHEALVYDQRPCGLALQRIVFPNAIALYFALQNANDFRQVLAASPCLRRDHFQNVSDPAMGLHRMPQGKTRVDGIVISPAFLDFGNRPRLL